MIKDHDDIEDVFDQSDEAEKRDLERQFKAYSAKFVKAGFREAFEDEVSNERFLQDSFDEAYKIAFDIALEVNSLRFTCKLIEGMYEDQRLKKTPQNIEKLTAFNAKLDGCVESLGKQLEISEAKEANEEAIRDKIKHLSICQLRKEAEDILSELQCPISL